MPTLRGHRAGVGGQGWADQGPGGLGRAGTGGVRAPASTSCWARSLWTWGRGSSGACGSEAAGTDLVAQSHSPVPLLLCPHMLPLHPCVSLMLVYTGVTPEG